MSDAALSLNAINKVRRDFNKPPLSWCDDCRQNAQALAEQIANSGGSNVCHGFLKDAHAEMGQNIAMGGKAFTFQKALAVWMQEESMYKRGNEYQPGCGHFTQVVWKDTTHFGVGVAKCGNKTFIVANYHPPGNFGGRFLQNV